MNKEEDMSRQSRREKETQIEAKERKRPKVGNLPTFSEIPFPCFSVHIYNKV